MQVSDIKEQEFRNMKSHLAKIIKERDRYRGALEKIEEGDESEIWETFPDVAYDEAVRLYAKQALEKDDGQSN